MIELSVEDRVATLTLCRPELNAISSEWVDLFGRLLDELAAVPDCAVLVIRSDQRVFGAGADLAEFRTRFSALDGSDQMLDFLVRIQKLFSRVEALPQVTIAELGGAAMGGSFELALVCDLRIAADEASMGLPEARLGLIPGAGGTQRLTRLCGPGVASRMILTADVIKGAEAAVLGLVQWSVPRSQLRDKVASVTAAVSQLSASALAASKACIAAADEAAVDGFERERAATRLLFDEGKTRDRIGRFLNKQL